MDKDKLMQMIDDYSYMENLSGSKYGYMADLPRDVFEDLVDRQENIRREIYSKSVMPKVFDEWVQKYRESAQDTYYLLGYFNDLAFEKIKLFDGNGEVQIESDESIQLVHWLWQNKSFEYSKYLKCVEAIIKGYEVEK